MSMAELLEETTRRLLKAKIEIPTQYRGDKTEVLNWEKGKEARLEKCVDEAWATTERWCDKTKRRMTRKRRRRSRSSAR